MPQLYLILGVVTLLLGNLKDLFSSIKIGEQNKKLIRWGLVGVVIYCVYKIIVHNLNKTNALSDVHGSLAVELHTAIYSQAFNLKIWGLGSWHVGNGDEQAVLAISERITNYTQVAKFYKDLYEIDLYTDLEKILDSDQIAQFNANLQRNTGEQITTVGGVASVQTPKPPAVSSAVYCNASGKVNIRSANDSNKVLYQVDKNTTYYTVFGKGSGYVGDFVRERKITIAGVPYTAWEVDIPYEKQVGLVNLNYGLNGLIVKEFAYIKA
ncbi:hypothetical protein [Arcicella lustrica]|uniref:Uncharacterized protein n=1 Tax=Arcicella lustrica TaxID=2984196 RepID=A0ABU5SHP3_9BACT|nr:hypothetical protein [Arcicella sp. DC25W]MEA5426805.1 hypothetical protein [Arcicella sp. DC25W]